MTDGTPKVASEAEKYPGRDNANRHSEPTVMAVSPTIPTSLENYKKKLGHLKITVWKADQALTGDRVFL